MRAGRIEATDTDSAVAIVRLVGEHDLSTAAELRDAFNTAFERDRAVVIDMSAVEFIDSSIVAVLVEGDKAGQQPTGKSVAMYVPTNVSESVRRVLELTGLVSHMTIRQSLDDAIGAVSGEG